MCAQRNCLVVLTFIGLVGMSGCGPAPLAAPSSYTNYQSKDGSFDIDFPSGWKQEGGGKKGMAWAKFGQGSAEIRINTDTAGSLLGDISKLGTGGEAPVEELEPEAQVHEMRKDLLAEEIDGYQEESPAVVETAIGRGRKSKFTGSGSFGGKLHGYRATVLSRDLRIAIVCKCSDSDWKVVQPVFDKVIDSLKPGTGGEL